MLLQYYYHVIRVMDSKLRISWICSISATTNCNDENSFLCGLTKCIPSSFVCDGLVDCPGGRDEENCPSPNSCQEFWNAGYEDSGEYRICMWLWYFKTTYFATHMLASLNETNFRPHAYHTRIYVVLSNCELIRRTSVNKRTSAVWLSPAFLARFATDWS